MTKDKFVQIILGAGRPFRGEQNASLKRVSEDSRVLDWILQAVKFLNPKVHFIAGYQIDEIVSRYPNLHYQINPKWSSTGSIISLLEAQILEDSKYIVSYGDILFRKNTVRKLINVDADVTIAVDSMWKDRFSNRTIKDINRSEKVIISGERMLKSGSNISTKNANAEFIGLLSFKPEIMKFLHDHAPSFSQSMRRSNLGRLLEFLQKYDFDIKVVDVKSDWAELNEAQDLANFILGTKAQSLKRLEEVITKSKIAPQISFTVEKWNNNSEKIIEKIQNKFRSKKVIIRSSAISEDGFVSSNAGAYVSILDVDISVKKEILDSISKVIESYIDGNLANQILVQPMIENVTVSGVVFTRSLSESAPYYVVNFDDSSQQTDSITSGASSDHKTLVILRNKVINSEKFVPHILSGLIPAIKEIEVLLNYGALDIEFAIDINGSINILQVRPLTSNNYEIDKDNSIFESLENCMEKFNNLQKKSPFIVGGSTIFGVMPDWNPAEIIGTKPNSLSFDLYRYLITDEVWATQRAEYGYRDVKPHPLIVSFSGHPYVDVRASFNSFIPANLGEGLAGRLVDFYVSRLSENPHYHDKVEFEILPTCYAFNFDHWRKILSKGKFSSDEIDQLQESLHNITKNAILRTQNDFKNVDIFKKRFDMIFSSNLSILDKAITLLEDCRRYGTLVFAHLARSAFISITLLKSAVEKKVISSEAMDSFLNSIETVAHEFLEDAKMVADKKKSWSSFIDRYGHLRPGTYDITSESYRGNPEKYLRPVVKKAGVKRENSIKKDTDWLKERALFLDSLSKMFDIKNKDIIEDFLKNSIEGREYAKFIFTRNLSTALDLISEYGKIIGINKTQLANTSLGSFFILRTGNISAKDASSWLEIESNQHRKYHHTNKKIELPPLITTEHDFNIFIHPSSQPNYVGSGRVSAEITTIKPNIVNYDSSFLKQKILLIPQADPGFDWIFGHNIAGLITMFGGGNSHMAIRAKEFGLPAVIGVGEAQYKSLSAASIIELDVTNRRIKVIS